MGRWDAEGDVDACAGVESATEDGAERRGGGGGESTDGRGFGGDRGDDGEEGEEVALKRGGNGCVGRWDGGGERAGRMTCGESISRNCMFFQSFGLIRYTLFLPLSRDPSTERIGENTDTTLRREPI